MGLLIVIVSLVFGVVFTQLAKYALLNSTDVAIQSQAKEDAKYIAAKIDRDLSVLNEVALRARTTAMEWETQKSSLSPEVERLGYINMYIVTPDLMAKDVKTEASVDVSEREYVKKVFAGELNISTVMISKATGEPIIIEAAPIKANGKVVGALIASRDANYLSEVVGALAFGEKGYAFLLDSTGTMNAHANVEYVLNQQNVIDDIANDGVFKSFGMAYKDAGMNQEAIVKYSVDAGNRIAGMAPVPGTDFILGVVADEAEVLADVTKITYIIIATAIVMILLGIIAAVFLGNMISKPIRRLKDVSDQLALGDADISLEVTSNDEIGELTASFIAMADGIKIQSEAAERIAKGDMSVELVSRSSKDILSISLMAVVNNLRALIEESNILVGNAVNGELEERGNAEAFEGGFKDIISGFNATLDAIVVPLREAFGYIEKISAGEVFEIHENNYKGEYKALIDNLAVVRGTILGIADAIGRITKNIGEGQFKYREDESLLKGTYAEMVGGINATVDILIDFIETSQNYMGQIGNGNIPEKVTEEYQGDFNKVKQSINDCIDGLGGLVEGRDVLSRMTLNDYGVTVNGTYQGIFNEIATSINQVGWRVNSTVDVLINMAAGDFKDLQGLKDLGKRCDEDRLVPTMVLTIETIKELIEETRILSENAVKGNLSARGHIEKFNGEYCNVIKGINDTLDAVIAPVQEASAILQEVAKGKLNTKLEGD